MDVKIKEHNATAELSADVRDRATAIREQTDKLTDEQARAKGWGRRVTIGDVAKFHRKRRNCKHCHGDVEMTIWVKGVATLHICQRAMDDFSRICGGRSVNTPDGPRWLLGVEPENFALWTIFHASVVGHQRAVATRNLLNARCKSGGNGRWLL